MGERLERAALLVLVAVLAVLLAVWGAFLVPLRVGGVPVPVSVVLAVAGNLGLGLVGGRLYGRAGAAVPAVLWFAVALPLQSRRAEGDVVVPASLTGLAFLLLGSLAAAVALGVAPTSVEDRRT